MTQPTERAGPPRECEHGSLARVCQTCEYAETIAELRTEVELLRNALGIIANYDKNMTDEKGNEMPGRYAVHPGIRFLASAALLRKGED